MIRGLIMGILRVFFWIILFYVVATVVRTIVSALTPRRRGNPDHQPPSTANQPDKPVIKYDDVKDASFKEMKENRQKDE